MMPTDVGAVVICHSRPELAMRCASALGDQIGSTNVVIVANLASTEAALAGRGVKVIGALPAPLGYGANVNRGVEALPHDLVLVTNDDVVPHACSVAALRAAILDDPCLAVVAPQLVDESGRRSPCELPFPTVRSEAAQALMAPKAVERWLQASIQRTADERWVQGAVLLVRRRPFEAVGGYDERFFLYSEEVDLARRLYDAGWRVQGVPGATMLHVGGATIEDPGDAMFRRERRRYIGLHWTRQQRLALHPTMAMVFAWNLLYTATRSVLDPSRRDEVILRCRNKWAKRPTW